LKKFTVIIPLIIFLYSNEIDERKALVKIFATQVKPNFKSPWQMLSSKNGTGSGCIFNNKYILTCAHNVAYGSFIQVKKYGDTKKYIATVKYIGKGINILLNNLSSYLATSHPEEDLALQLL